MLCSDLVAPKVYRRRPACLRALQVTKASLLVDDELLFQTDLKLKLFKVVVRSKLILLTDFALKIVRGEFLAPTIE
jgi:hypothetical protein